jgi:exopolyphosphatase/guanosine-5'-triphosphate,3'-diphosphate pyrophosphatase
MQAPSHVIRFPAPAARRSFVKLAAIDIGSNSVHMIIVGTHGEHSFEVLDREKEMVFLGRSVFEHGRLTEQAFSAGLEAISKLHKLALRHGVEEVRAVATSAVREAENGGEFLYAVADQTGILPQVISGAEEAHYIYLAVRNAIDLSSRTALVFDVGGGSVETIVGNARELSSGRSLKLGVQRLRAEFGGGAPLSKRQKKALESRIRDVAASTIEKARKKGFDLVVGTSGTILALGQAVHRAQGREPWTTPSGQVIELGELSNLTERLVAIPAAERANFAGVDTRRADTIHVGGVLLTNLLELAGVDRITLCDSSLREGVVLDYLDRAAEDIRSYEVVSDIRRHSVLDMARRTGQTGPHPERVARLSLELFDQTRTLHRLGSSDRALLEYAAILHDVGQHIGYERHEQHAAYIIRNGELRGFSEQEREVLALLARYHRKSRPKRRDADYTALPRRRRRSIRVLAGILRVADGLDRSHHQLVRSVQVDREGELLTIRVQATGDSELDVWGARRKSKLLARALGVKLRIVVEPVASIALESA